MSSSTLVGQRPDPFAPSTTVKPDTSPKDSKRDVTIPYLPELYDPLFLDKLLPAKPISDPASGEPEKPPKQGDEFMAALKTVTNRKFTQNEAHAYASTLSATVDAFNGLSQATSPKDFDPLLHKSWKEDPLLTLKIIFNLRSIHEGKSEREGFYRSWGWLYRNHPRTAITNLEALVNPLIERKLKEKRRDKDSKKLSKDEDDVVLLDEDGEEVLEEKTVRGMSHGYWKDLLNLLVLAANGEFNSSSASFNSIHPEKMARSAPRSRGRYIRKTAAPTSARKRGHSAHKKGTKDPQTRDTRIKESLKVDEAASKAAQTKRENNHALAREKVQKLFQTSPSFKALYVTVARLFAKGLEEDINTLEKIADPATDDKERVDLTFHLSLCAKYAPSIGASHDRTTNIASAIAELLWTKGKLRIPYDQAQSQNLSVEHVHSLRSAYTRWALSPLRRFLQIPELYMSSNRWSELPYSRVPSSCMQKNKSLFHKHDQERFSKYLLDVATGKRVISGATLLPHTLLKEALNIFYPTKEGDPAVEAALKVIEAQWKTMVDKLRESGSLDNCLAVCDVSGSMGNLMSQAKSQSVRPILPAVALSLVLAQVSRAPWANHFITFSANPELVEIDPADGLVGIAKSMSRAEWGMNTNFNAVFTRLILPMAVEHKLPKEEMIKRLFVFSDMEFDRSGTAPSDQWTTEHEKIAEAFEEAGYEVPEIVYWNLQGAQGAKPVQASWEGVALMSGFSSNMIKTFMEGGETEKLEERSEGDDGVVVVKQEKNKTTPEDVMRKALNKPSYATLVVVD